MGMSKPYIRHVDRTLEPGIVSGRGMHVLGFMSPGSVCHKNLFQRPSLERSAPPDASSAPSGCSASSRSPIVVDDGAPVRGPTRWKSGRPIYEYGNYGAYYGYRHHGEHAAAEETCSGDKRLAALETQLGEDFFAGKDVLDIGCNAGLVSIEVGRRFRAASVLGVDIDEALVVEARANRRNRPRTSDGDGGKVKFRAEDILTSPLCRPPEFEPERFDVILCLSVTKWIHFARGDSGIRKFFRRCLRRLRPGGFFVVEPQDWSSYKKKRHLTPEIRRNVAGIELRPEAFKECLTEEIGFEWVNSIGPPADGPKGFRRPIHVFRRPVVNTELADEQLPRKKRRKLDSATTVNS
jgi:7SK snRNA methylphosphate capping enzyme